eukprot:TRINITY_DN233_c0_g1_i1.p1 TRINITY_DN233_c0_g1~~TRINITY_DN233_c0_g1_i1.p1  ORF type:complete len:393 (+),score=84.23 TRINITY_DN233_c0_g1_i1:208-1386(+)
MANLVHCTACLRQYPTTDRRAPTVYPCGHVLCQRCAPEANRPCYSCFTSNSEEPDANQRLRCSHCGQGRSTLRCEDCARAYCEACATAVHRSASTKSHLIMPMSPKSTSKPKTPTQCVVHSDPLELICLDCNIVLCLKCRYQGPHVGHRIEPLDDVIQDLREQTTELVARLEEVHRTTAQTLRAVEDAVEELGGAESSGEMEVGTAGVTKQWIRCHFEKLHELLDERRDDLLMAVDLVRQEKLDRLVDQQSRLGVLQSRVHKSRKHAESALEGGDGAFASELAELMEELEELALTNVRPDPVECSSIPVSFGKQLESAIKHHGSVTIQSSKSNHLLIQSSSPACSPIPLPIPMRCPQLRSPTSRGSPTPFRCGEEQRLGDTRRIEIATPLGR